MQWPNSYTIGYGVTLVFAVVSSVTLYRYYYKKAKNWRKVGTVSKLFLHPVKSMRGIDLSTLSCFSNGTSLPNRTLHDRSFIVIQPDGNMMTARKEPLLVTISVELEDGLIILSAPGKPTIKFDIPEYDEKAFKPCKVWGEPTFGLDCGDEVANWLYDYLTKEYRLYYHPLRLQGRGISARDKQCQPLFADKGNIMYHDSTPCTILSESSIEDLNLKLENKVVVRRFRPNILVSGCKPYEEDTWKHVKIGEVELEFVRNTFRCVLITVDVDTGIMDLKGDPLKTLQTYRLCKPELRSRYGTAPLFGTSLAVIKEGRMNVGDTVYAC